MLNVFTEAKHMFITRNKPALPFKFCICFIHLPSNMAACMLRIFQSVVVMISNGTAEFSGQGSYNIAEFSGQGSHDIT